MIIKKFLLPLSFVILTSVTSLYAADIPITATADISPAILSGSVVNDIDFGDIIISDQDSEITIDASAGSATPAVTSGNAFVANGTCGVININSNIDANVSITYPLAAVTINDGGGNTMDITQITAYSTPGPLSVAQGVPTPLYVGGVLSVAASQTAGTYSNTFNVTVNY